MAIELEFRERQGTITVKQFYQPVVHIGSESDCDFIIDLSNNSSDRFRIEMQEDGATLISSSDAPLIINKSSPVEDGETSVLRHGDVIRIGHSNLRITFRYTDKPAPAESVSPPAPTEPVTQSAPTEPVTHSAPTEPVTQSVLAESDTTVTQSQPWLAFISKNHRVRIAIAVSAIALLAVLLFSFFNSPGARGNLPPIEISIVVKEHETAVVDLLEVIRRESAFTDEIIQNVTQAANVVSAVELDADRGSVTFTPTETDAPNDFNLHLDCVMQNPHDMLQFHQAVVIHCQFIEVADLTVVKPIRSFQIGLSDPKAIHLPIAAFDPDLPQDELVYTSAENLPAGASLDPVTGLFIWTPTDSQYGSNYRISIEVTKKSAPQLVTRTDFDIQLVDDLSREISRDKYEKSLYVLWLKDPTGKFIQPVATTIAVGPGTLVTNATTVRELQQQVFHGWTVEYSAIDQAITTPITDMFVHGYFTPSRKEHGVNSYQSIFFDVGVIRFQSLDNAFVEFVDANAYTSINIDQDVDLFSVNIAERLDDNSEVLVSRFTRGKIETAHALAISESSKVTDFSILEVQGSFSEFIDGAPLLADGKVLGLYATPVQIDGDIEPTHHLFTVPICLDYFDPQDPSGIWIPAETAFAELNISDTKEEQ